MAINQNGDGTRQTPEQRPTQSRVLFGTLGNDIIRGTVGNDTIFGLSGDDFIDGGAGIDRLYGGTGNDTYVVNSASDQVIEKPNEGIDRVIANSTSYTLSDNVENLTLTGKIFNDVPGFFPPQLVGNGNWLNNVIQGSNDSNNLLDGKGGDDTLIGGNKNDNLLGNGGNDALVGGAGYDTLNGYGTAGRFFLGGILSSVRLPAPNQDTLTGGTGADTFVLGDTDKSFYIDSSGGRGDRAVITDFKQFEGDKIVLHGSAQDYRLEVSSSLGVGTAALDTAIYQGNDLIGIIQDNVEQSLTSSSFVYPRISVVR